MFLYDGKDGNLISTLGGEKAHKGGIYAVSCFLCLEMTLNYVLVCFAGWI